MVSQQQMPPVHTVSQIVALMKGSLERQFSSVDIEAEISNFRASQYGHMYFALKDEGAQLSAVLFSRVPCDCRAALADGRRVKVRGRVSMYPQRGECQFIVTRIKIAGEGELMARYLELKARLEKEGLFAASRKRPLPPLPRRIAIVTSPSGAVIHDMCRVLTRRFANVEIRLYPALVQGADAPPSIIEGIRHFASAGKNDWQADILIVARGGGSFEDLFPFNDERLVRAIAASPIPVISAVGHETDFTLCDFVADKRAGTPSIAAEIAVPVLADVRRRIADTSTRMSEALSSRLDLTSQHLDRLSSSLGVSLKNTLQITMQRLQKHASSLDIALKQSATDRAHRLEIASQRIEQARATILERAAVRLKNASAQLELLSPFAVLSRGYSITTEASGAVVTDASTLSEGAEITTRLAHGSVSSIAQKTVA